MIDQDKGNMTAAAHQMGLYIAQFERDPRTLPDYIHMQQAALGILCVNWAHLCEAERGVLAMMAAALHIHSRRPGTYFKAWLRAVGRLVIRKLSSAP
jgi:hypothetical protein